MDNYERIDYLMIGHICQDLMPGEPVPGGTALYSARTAQALGCRVAVVTSTPADVELSSILPGIPVHIVPSTESTTFENLYSAGRRIQRISGIASTLEPEDVPSEWKRASIVHLGPIAGEINQEIIRLFSNSIIGLTPQGWFRRWDSNGHVFPGEWVGADDILPFAAAIILSPEDLPNEHVLVEMQKKTPVVAVTYGAAGCVIYCQDTMRKFTAPTVEEVNPTGAGDIFAAAFLVRLQQTKGNPWEAAEFATSIASATVTKMTLNEKVETIQEVLSREG